MKKIIIIFSLTVMLITSLLIAEQTEKESLMKLKITGFNEGTAIEKAGAKIGDILLTYDGKPVYTLKQLAECKEAVKTDEVEVTLLRGQAVIPIKIPKGQIGVYLQELIPDHKMDDNAVVIDGIGKLGWGIGMENSFLGALTLIEEKFGQKTSYEDLVGLSGYGFRLHFFDGFCPSSPDATCGKNVGEDILKKLGYDFDVYHLQSDEFIEKDLEMRSEEEMRKIILKSIDKGFPVIAIDLIEVPEWGLITGYQKDGKELFCRTYFDKTDGYEIARKFPWIIFVIKDHKKANISPLYAESFEIANELYNTEKYDEYFSGIKAIEEWIIDLKDEKSYKEADKKVFDEMKLANWWIYYSLMEAKSITKEYLLNNIEKFKKDKDLVTELAEIYNDEAEFLYKHFQQIPSPHVPNPDLIWDQENREKQIQILNEFLELEKEANEILKKI